MLDIFVKIWHYCRLERLSLVWQISIPFFLLATFGTCLLLFVSTRAENILMSRYEERILYDGYKVFESHVRQKGLWALSLANTFASSDEAKKFIKDKNRDMLIKLFKPAYEQIKDRFSVSQLHFHDASGRSFLRFHAIELFGDDLISYRKTITNVHRTKEGVSGIERGITGLSIRGVSPILDNLGDLVGTVEVGFRIDRAFLEEIKESAFVEITILVPEEAEKEPGESNFIAIASTYRQFLSNSSEEYKNTYLGGIFHQLLAEMDNKPFRVLVAPCRDYSGKPVGVVEFALDRSSQLASVKKYIVWMILLGVFGVLVSVLLIYLISFSFTRPIIEMINFAIKIASGQQLKKLEIRPSGELGMLADALNEMITSLDESHRKLEEYSQKLEEMVHIRTRALRESEEKYRTLVENIPLVVYRALSDGKIVFVNKYVETMMGMTVEEILSNKGFWKEKVAPEERPLIWPIMDKCLKEGFPFSVEYRMQLPNSKSLHVREHALPVIDEKGEVEIVDGFIADVSDRYQLQQQIIRTEELKTLSEISARLAHEIRNPIAVAGGFARRLLQEFPPDSDEAKKLNIILSEIRRLEEILSRTMDYLKPFEIATSKTDLKDYLENFLKSRGALLSRKDITWSLDVSPDLPHLSIDGELVDNGLHCVVGTLVYYAKPNAHILCKARREGKFVIIEFTTEPVQISEDDLEHFFYPFTRHRDAPEMMDLPIAKIIIHKHGGWIELNKISENAVRLAIFLPF